MGAGRALASWLILTTWFSHGRAPYCPAPLGAPVNTGPALFVNSFKRMCRECFSTQDPYKMGYMAVYGLQQVINGEDLNHAIIDTGSAIVTAENIDDPEIQAVINPK